MIFGIDKLIKVSAWLLVCTYITGCERVSLQTTQIVNHDKNEVNHLDKKRESSGGFCRSQYSSRISSIDTQMHSWFMSYSPCLADGRKQNETKINELNNLRGAAATVAEKRQIDAKVNALFASIHETCAIKYPKPQCEEKND